MAQLSPEGEFTPSDKAGTPATSSPGTSGNNSQTSLPTQKEPSNLVAHEGTTEKEHGSNFVAPEVVIEKQHATLFAIVMGGIASIGGFIFGYESGQISGFLQMTDFLRRFGELKGDEYVFSAARQGTIVALLCAGTMVGCLGSGWICDNIGRKFTISAAAFFYIIGVIIEVTSSTIWVQFAMGRFIAGLGIGALSTSVPMYQSESTPKQIRSQITASYQLLITLGIWTAYMINWGTHSAFSNSAQWRISNGLSAAWAIVLGTGILFMPESPRYQYRQGKIVEARKTLSKIHGLPADSSVIASEISEIQKQITHEEKLEKARWIECFMRKDRMLYRTLLGMVLQAGQQLTGANFFFYYGTSIFKSVGLSSSYVTSIILGTVNVVATIFSLWMVTRVGRRKALIGGALWMFICFMIYTFVGTYGLKGHDGTSGAVLIVFTCLFICAFATTWGPLVWTIVSELYPPRYRAQCMALATASNWFLNFLISFFTTFITNRIHYWYGMVFGISCLALAIIVYFCLIESKDRSLEELDFMYVTHVNPMFSANWTDDDYVKGGRLAVKKDEASAPPLMVHEEEAPRAAPKLETA